MLFLETDTRGNISYCITLNRGNKMNPVLFHTYKTLGTNFPKHRA
jgi:hypothetical protein